MVGQRRVGVKRFALLLLAVLAGCGSSAGVGGAGEQDPDSLYPWGSKSSEIEQRFGRATVHWMVGQAPADEYAAASVRSMIASGRPRPAAYQVYAQTSAVPGRYDTDYVFYNDQLRVLYVVRRRAS